jgi:hypothetical protein
MWSFNWGVFWAMLPALVIANAIAKVVAILLPWNVTLSLSDSQALQSIVGKLESIESLLEENDSPV